MGKDLHAVQFDGTTFGMEIDTKSEAFKFFKKNVKLEKCKGCLSGLEIDVLVVPHMALAAIMREAHWLVSENKEFNHFHIDGFRSGEEIYIRYTADPIDFGHRLAFRKELEK